MAKFFAILKRLAGVHVGIEFRTDWSIMPDSDGRGFQFVLCEVLVTHSKVYDPNDSGIYFKHDDGFEVNICEFVVRFYVKWEE